MASNTDVVKNLYYNMSVLCLWTMRRRQPSIYDDEYTLRGP